MNNKLKVMRAHSASSELELVQLLKCGIQTLEDKVRGMQSDHDLKFALNQILGIRHTCMQLGEAIRNKFPHET